MTVIKTTRNNKPYYLVRWGFHYVDGKRKYKQRGFKYRKDATAFEQSLLNNEAATAAPARITVQHLCARYIDEYAELNLAKRTRIVTNATIKHRINPFLGHVHPDKITIPLIIEWQEWMLTSGKAQLDRNTGEYVRRPATPATANKALAVLSSIMTWARQRGLAANQLADVPKLKDTSTHQPTPFTPKQIQQLADACTLERDRVLITTMAYTGIRWSEARALTWQDIDIAQRLVRINKAIDVDGSITATKTRRNRTAAILEPAVEALASFQQATSPTPGSLVFCSQNCTPLSGNWYKRNRRRIEKATGITFTPHALRDTYASLLIAAGVDMAELTLWLGHSSIDVTLKHYAGLYADQRIIKASKADKLVANMLA